MKKIKILSLFFCFSLFSKGKTKKVFVYHNADPAHTILVNSYQKDLAQKSWFEYLKQIKHLKMQQIHITYEKNSRISEVKISDFNQPLGKEFADHMHSSKSKVDINIMFFLYSFCINHVKKRACK